jgi:hypothetical protein
VLQGDFSLMWVRPDRGRLMLIHLALGTASFGPRFQKNKLRLLTRGSLDIGTTIDYPPRNKLIPDHGPQKHGSRIALTLGETDHDLGHSVVLSHVFLLRVASSRMLPRRAPSLFRIGS